MRPKVSIPRIRGKSTVHTEAELIDLLYEFLKDKAEFKIE